MFRTAIRLGLLLLLAHAMYQFVPVYWHYYQFKDGVKETALYSKGRSDAQIVDRVMELAAQYDVPLDRDAVQIRRQLDHTFIDAAWVEPVELLPMYPYRWKFTVAADAWHIEPPVPPGSR